MVTPAVQLYINKLNVLVNLDGAKNVLIDKQHGQNWKKGFGFFQWAAGMGWGSWTDKSRLELAFLSFHCIM